VSRPFLITPEALLLGPLAALVVAAPAAVRVAAGGYSLGLSWLATAGLLAIPATLAIAAARLARRSLGPYALPYARSLVAVWALVSVPADALLASVLMSATHQRALGGITFAVLALATNAAAFLAGLRARQVVASMPRERAARAANALGGLALLMVVAVVALAVVAGHPYGPGYHHRAVLLDACLAVAAGATAVALDLPQRRTGGAVMAGGGGAIALVVVAFLLLVRSPGLAREVSEQMPLVASMGEVLGLAP
jgi:hypothetical protein